MLLILALFAGAWGLERFPGAQTELVNWIGDKTGTANGVSGQAVISLEEIPPFSGTPYVEINGNMPYFE